MNLEPTPLQQRHFNGYQWTAIISLVFALTGFSYNAWRLEASEANATIRTASFQMLLELGQLEQLVYAAHYDQNPELGNLRTGWVKVGLVRDLSMLSTEPVQKASAQLASSWQQHSDNLPSSRAATDQIIIASDAVRAAIKQSLIHLQ